MVFVATEVKDVRGFQAILLIILTDVSIRPVKEVLVGVKFVFEEGAAEGLFHFPLALSGGLPAVEADLLHDVVNVGHDALDDDMRVLALHLVEKFGQG